MDKMSSRLVPALTTGPSLLAWHFVGAKLRNGRPIPPDGETLRYDGRLVPCESGLHASEQVRDALNYAPGETLCRVRCGGEIVRDTDKLVCTERTIIWRFDATDLLCEFARCCALDVAHLWNAPEVVFDYLRTGNEETRAAVYDAASDAASAASDAASTASVTTWAAASAATWAAASAAAAARANRAAAYNTASDTAWFAANAAASAATRNAQNKRLIEMVERARSGVLEAV